MSTFSGISFLIGIASSTYRRALFQPYHLGPTARTIAVTPIVPTSKGAVGATRTGIAVAVVVPSCALTPPGPALRLGAAVDGKLENRQ